MTLALLGAMVPIMLTIRLDRASPIPLYYQIQQQLRKAIMSGELGPGDPIPPETSLAADAAVSRFTIRQAIDDLVREGLVVRHRGRGTFVTFSASSPAAKPLSSFSEALGRLGVTPSDTLKSFGEGAPSPAARTAFGLRSQDAVVNIVRLRERNGEAVALEHITVPTSVAPEMRESDVHGSPIGEVLRRKYGVEVTRAHETLRVASLDKEAAESLDARSGSASFLLERQSFAGDRLVELREIQIRPDRFQFELAPSPAELERD